MDNPTDAASSRIVDSLWRKVQNLQFVILITIGIIALFASIIIEANLALSAAASIPLKYRNDPIFLPWYENWRTLGFGLRDLGFASFIALILAIVIERGTRERLQESIDQALKLVIADVTQAAFGVQQPRAIVKHVVAEVLSAPINRSNLRLQFTIKNIPEDLEEEKQIEKGRFRILEVRTQYDLHNASGVAVEHMVRALLPVPGLAKLRDLARVIGGKIGPDFLNDPTIKKGDEAIDDTDIDRRYAWPIRVEPGASVHVVISYQVVKEKSDNEIWTSLLPSSELEVAVVMLCDDLEWNVDPRHSGMLEPEDKAHVGPRRLGQAIFSNRAPLLPFQGVTVFWRPIVRDESDPK